jgi:CelD/BcsL family acetyltransferase involved in cellulose biosynthesis
VTATVALPFRVGARTVWRLRRRLVRVPFSLEQAQRREVPRLPVLDESADGYWILSLPAEELPALAAAHPRLRPFVRQRYRRCYASLEGTFEDYLSGFSSKSRSTLKRKVRKLAEASGGALDLGCYQTPEQVEEFYRYARAVSALTYQERLLNAGLPEGEPFLEEMRSFAARDAMRGWVLFLGGRPVSYLYAPADGAALVYLYLGYDPQFADLSPGTVLQYEAMRQLMGEGRFRLFDFTEGEGQHKRFFSTGDVECLDLLLLKPTAANLLAGWSLTAFDAGVAFAKRLVRRRSA